MIGYELVIEVERLTKYFGKHPALQEVTFSVNEAEIFGFLGPNGAGKTTAIRSIMQLIAPDAGQIRLFGQAITRNSHAHRNRIGYLPGDFKPPAEMKASYFLDYVARFRNRPPDLRQSLIRQLKLSDSDLDKKQKYLSHGTRQKIGLVSAMEHDPDLIILDEPTLGLDPLIQEVFFELLLDFKNRGKTVFLSSHILTEIERVCQRVAIIRAGRIVTVRRLDELKQNQPRRLIIEFKNDYAVNPPILKGTTFIKKHNDRFFYLTDSSAADLIRELSKWPIKTFEFPQPELEDIFMAYYQDGQND